MSRAAAVVLLPLEVHGGSWPGSSSPGLGALRGRFSGPPDRLLEAEHLDAHEVLLDRSGARTLGLVDGLLVTAVVVATAAAVLALLPTASGRARPCDA